MYKNHSWTTRLSLITAVAMVAVTIFNWSSRPQSAQATPARIAVIDVNKVLMQTSAGKTAYTKLKTLQDQKIAQANKLQAEITALENDINAKKVSLSEAQLNTMSAQLSDKRIAMQRYAQDADREVAEQRDRTMQDLDNKLKPVVDALGKEMGLAAIFNKFESGLIYASDAIDITDTVITRFNTASPADSE
jgi:outer membrane protein